MRAVAFIGSVLAVLASAPCQTYTQKLVSRYVAHSDAIPNDLDWSKGLVVAGKVTWLLSPEGLWRKEPDAAARDRTQFFAGRRYLPEGEIMAVADDHAGGIWVRTRDGVSHIEMHPMTLEQKAQFFERRVHERHDRYGLVASSTLTEPGNLKSNRLTPSDNDGLWTAMYAAAECFRYAVTRSPEALANARKSVEAVLFLERVTGRAGFPARSYIREGDWRPTDGVWHWTADGHYEWKADTSSDEIVGHFFIFSIAHDLLPDGDLKRRIDATARRIMDHILEHGYHLADIDGKPTTWGKWSRMYFDGAGRSDSALNAVELLSFLKTTHHITGDPKYDREYRKAALDLGYAEQGTRYLELRTEINYSDEELAMLSFYPLFQYEKSPKLLRYYRDAAGQWWQNISREKNPLWTLIYAHSKPARAPDFDGARWILNRIPMDLVEWTVSNSNRPDAPVDGGLDRFRHPQTTMLLPPDERPVMKWNGNPFRIDGGSGGKSEDDGAFFLLPYWMARYDRVIR